jgi:hypothetical protein
MPKTPEGRKVLSEGFSIRRRNGTVSNKDVSRPGRHALAIRPIHEQLDVVWDGDAKRRAKEGMNVPIVRDQPVQLSGVLVETIAHTLRRTYFIENALAMCGISRSQFVRWVNVACGFGDAKKAGCTVYTARYLLFRIQKAIVEIDNTLTEIIEKAGQKDWKAAAWLKEKRFPQRWGSLGHVEFPDTDEDEPAWDRDDVLAAIGIQVETGPKKRRRTIPIEVSAIEPETGRTPMERRRLEMERWIGEERARQVGEIDNVLKVLEAKKNQGDSAAIDRWARLMIHRAKLLGLNRESYAPDATLKHVKEQDDSNKIDPESVSLAEAMQAVDDIGRLDKDDRPNAEVPALPLSEDPGGTIDHVDNRGI